MASLYELSAWYADLLEQYDHAETDDEREEIIDALLNAEGDMAEKAEAYAKVIRNKEAEAKAFKDESDRLGKKADAAMNVAKRLKQAMLDAMKLTDTQSINTSIGKWRLQQNPWSCEVVDADRVPIEFHIKQEDKIDKKSLLAKFKADGEIVDGVLFSRDIGIRFQ